MNLTTVHSKNNMTTTLHARIKRGSGHLHVAVGMRKIPELMLCRRNKEKLESPLTKLRIQHDCEQSR